MVEQGCVPILRMGAGDLDESLFQRGSAESPRRSRAGEAVDKNDEHVHPRNTSQVKPMAAAESKGYSIEADIQMAGIKTPLEHSRITCGQQNNTESVFLGGRYLTGNVVDVPQSPPEHSSRRYGDEALHQMPRLVVESRDKTANRTWEKASRDAARSAARSLLHTIAREVCTSLLARLVRVTNSSGNRKLRANVVVAIVLLSLEKEGLGGAAGREVKTSSARRQIHRDVLRCSG